jgi:hypothetical protein
LVVTSKFESGQLSGRPYFRDLYGRLPSGSAVVIDNHQEASGDSPFDSVLREGIGELANRVTGNIGWEDLRLTFDETVAVTSGARRLDTAAIRILHDRAQGWVAGLVLMLDDPRRSGAIEPGTSTS